MVDADKGAVLRAAIEKIPSVRGLRESLDGYELLAALFLGPSGAEDINTIKDQLDDLVDLIVSFYELLGDRHWVFSDYISLSKAREIVSAESADAGEQILIQWLGEGRVLENLIMRLNRFQDMRPRMTLLEKAVRDYHEGRYYSVVLVLISVMDGFANDVDKQHRKGFHARSSEELKTEDTIATIEIGLPSAHAVFTESVKRRHDEELFDLKRHGIVHGMETNFDNAVIASKAWCMLFGLCDWATSILESKGVAEEEPEITFAELAERVKRHEKEKAIFEENNAKWEKHMVDLEQPSSPDQELIDSVQRFFEAWKTQNYGHLGQFFPNHTSDSFNKMAAEARDIYHEHPLSSYSIISIERPAPAVAEVKATLSSPEKKWNPRIRFVKHKDGSPVAEWEVGEWKVIKYGLSPFVDVLD